MSAPLSCPLLRAFLTAENALPPLKYARTPIWTLLRYARAAGAPLKTLAALPGILLISDGLRGLPRNLLTLSFDYSRIMDGPVNKRVGGTRILRNPAPGEFDAEMFERAFVGFSRPCHRADGTTEAGLVREDLLRLCEANRDDHGGTRRSHIFHVIELTALLDLFSHTDAQTGAAYVSTEEMRVLFRDGRLPA